jgi:hypothetical protein
VRLGEGGLARSLAGRASAHWGSARRFQHAEANEPCDFPPLPAVYSSKKKARLLALLAAGIPIAMLQVGRAGWMAGYRASPLTEVPSYPPRLGRGVGAITQGMGLQVFPCGSRLGRAFPHQAMPESQVHSGLPGIFADATYATM